MLIDRFVSWLYTRRIWGIHAINKALSRAKIGTSCDSLQNEADWLRIL